MLLLGFIIIIINFVGNSVSAKLVPCLGVWNSLLLGQLGARPSFSFPELFALCVLFLEIVALQGRVLHTSSPAAGRCTSSLMLAAPLGRSPAPRLVHVLHILSSLLSLRSFFAFMCSEHVLVDALNLNLFRAYQCLGCGTCCCLTPSSCVVASCGSSAVPWRLWLALVSRACQTTPT